MSRPKLLPNAALLFLLAHSFVAQAIAYETQISKSQLIILKFWSLRASKVKHLAFFVFDSAEKSKIEPLLLTFCCCQKQKSNSY